jgi:hypothetical protein
MSEVPEMQTKPVMPNFLIVGAAKSGTTSVYHYLKGHPDIFMSENKEPCFFSSYEVPPDIREKNVYPANGVRRLRDLDKYEALFALADPGRHKAIGEASTHYLFQYKETIENIKKLYDNHRAIKIIMILRSPIEAAYSNYTMWKMHGYETEPFLDVLKDSDRRSRDLYCNIAYIQKFRYHDQIKAYLENFDQVKILIHDDLNADADRFMKEIYQFLEINEDYQPENLGTHYNRSGKPRYKLVDSLFGRKSAFLKHVLPLLDRVIPSDKTMNLITRIRNWNLTKERLDSEIELYLKDKYGDDIERTARLIGRDLAAWLK